MTDILHGFFIGIGFFGALVLPIGAYLFYGWLLTRYDDTSYEDLLKSVADEV